MIPTVFERIFTEVADWSQSITHLSTYCTPFSVCISLSQPQNASLPILVTLLGMVTLVKLLHLLNA